MVLTPHDIPWSPRVRCLQVTLPTHWKRLDITGSPWRLWVIGAWPLLSWRTFLAKSKSQTSNLSSRKSLLLIGGGGNSKIFHVHPDVWGNDPIWRAYIVVVQMGWSWNHQLVVFLSMFLICVSSFWYPDYFEFASAREAGTSWKVHGTPSTTRFKDLLWILFILKTCRKMMIRIFFTTFFQMDGPTHHHWFHGFFSVNSFQWCGFVGI